MKKLVLLVLSIGIVFSGSSYGARLVKIGCVDVEEIFNSYPGTSDIREKLKKEKDKYQLDIDKQKDEVAKLESGLQLNYSKLTDDERQRRVAEIDYKKELLNEFIEDSNKKLAAFKEELTKPIYIKIYTMIKRVCAEKGFSFVIRKDSDSLLYSDREFDLTQEVRSRINKETTIEERN